MKRLMLFISLLFIFQGAAQASTGVTGRVSWRGEVVPGLKVRAYARIVDMASDKAVAVSSATAEDGTFMLALPPGSYYLTARSFDVKPRPGDYFGYFSGGPIQVRPGVPGQVVISLIKVPKDAEEKPAADRTGIYGDISFQGEPLNHSYLYVYKDPEEGFKGPGYLIQPVEKGHFQLRLPPGSYWLVARKRAKGGRYGPIEPGDYFSYYYGNPVRVTSGAMRRLEVEAIARQVPTDTVVENTFSGITGTVLGPDGLPAAGLYVFGYREAAMTGTPEVFSEQTGADGSYRLALPEAGTWYLLARQSFGGPAGEDELYGRYGGPIGKPIQFDGRQSPSEVVIRVARNAYP